MVNNDDEYVTHAECISSRKEVFTVITNIHDEVQKHGKALYGDDGRGGIQHDMTVTKETVGRIEDTLNGKDVIEVNRNLNGSDWAKIIAAIITTTGLVLIGFLQFVLPLMTRG